MGRITNVLAAAMLLAGAGNASAQDVDAVRAAMAGVFDLDHAACLASLAEQEADFATISLRTTARYETLNHAYEGHRLACEAARIETEIGRLEAEQNRLGAEIARLDAMWDSAVAANAAIRDYPGRNRSQLRMQGDIDRIADNVANLRDVAGNLREAAQSLLVLALRDLDDLSEASLDTLLTAMDVQAKNDILCRMLGCSGSKSLST